MCGIAGIITDRRDISPELERARLVQLHRGPDSQGFCTHDIDKWRVGLGHQRLSIIDLTEAGNQPMALADGKTWIIYNGEVYNYKEIRSELEGLGYHFRSTSDTEVMLAALHHWGVEQALNRFNGMWAFAFLDKEKKRLVLARDRMGVKPLYYLLKGGQLFFASEIKTILKMAQEKFSLNLQVIGEYLCQSLLDTGADTFFEGITKVPAAHYGVIDLAATALQIHYQSYWRVPTERQGSFPEKDLIEEIREIFTDAVRLRLRSDVPVGVFLSGGIDSSSIASTMKRLEKNAQLNIVSVVTQDKRYRNDNRYDESIFIDIMGNYLKQNVNKVTIDLKPETIFDYLGQVCWYNDEPAGGFANVAQFLLMKQAKELDTTVILSGQGGDELLAGYLKYSFFYMQDLVRKGQYLKASEVFWSFCRNGTVLRQFSFQEAKRYVPGYINSRRTDIRGENLKSFSPIFIGLSKKMTVQERQALDYQRFSVPILTHYEDRSSMAWSREVRNPFLDYRLVEAVVPLPMEMKIQGGWTKFIFRKAMEPFLPQEIVWRRDKRGFVNPQEEWLKDDLKASVLDYFCEDSLIFKFNLVDRKNLLLKYETYCRQGVGRGIISFNEIFNPLALEIWLRKYLDYVA